MTDIYIYSFYVSCDSLSQDIEYSSQCSTIGPCLLAHSFFTAVQQVLAPNCPMPCSESYLTLNVFITHKSSFIGTQP